MNKEIIEKYIQFAIENGMKFLVKEKIGFYPSGYHTFFIKADSFKFINDFEIKVEYNKAIANKNVEYAYHDIIGTDYINIKELITSKEFIKSITMGVFDNNDLLNKYSNYYYGDLTYFIDRDLEENLKNLSNSICKNQAIAIRDRELAEFITNLGIGEQLKNQ